MNTPEIKTTKDYNQFDSIIGNRNVSQKKVSNIVADIERGFNLLPYCPIIVFEKEGKLMIVDGQHRFEVSRSLGIEVYYVESNSLKLQQIASLNSRQDKWGANDFLNCYIKVGIEDYQTIKTLMSKYKINISVAISMLMENTPSSKTDTQLKFRNGEFKVNYYDETIDLLELSHSLFDRYKFYCDRNLISAVQKIFKKGLCDFDVLKAKIDSNPMLMDKQGTAKDYIYNIERVYNHKNSIRQTIF